MVIFALFFISTISSFTEPEKVYSIVKIIKPFNWYAEQSNEWKTVIDINPKDPQAWLNFYTANRMARLLNQDEYQKQLGSTFYELQGIVNSAKEKIPKTFEAEYIKIWNMDNYFDEVELLENTYNEYPERYELYEKMIVIYELTQNFEKRYEFNHLLYSKDNTLSSGLLAYNYNVLMSTDSNAVIITNGDNDTFPIWMLQDVFKIRKDVEVLNINLLTIDTYREKIFKKIGINLLDIDYNELSKSNNPYILFQHIVDYLAKNLVDRPLYIASSVHSGYFDNIKDSIYLTGLAFKYNPSEFDNIAYLKRNFESRFMLDILKKDFVKDFSESVTNTMNMNYLPMLLQLKKHYEVLNDTENLSIVKRIVKKLAKNSERAEEIIKAFNY